MVDFNDRFILYIFDKYNYFAILKGEMAVLFTDLETRLGNGRQ